MKRAWNSMTVMAALLLVAAIGLGAGEARASTGQDGVVNINTATVGQLQLLKGIGAKKAQAIVEQRGQAPFATVDELTKVKGIGQKLVDKLRGQLTVQGQTTLKAKPKKRKGRKRSSD